MREMLDIKMLSKLVIFAVILQSKCRSKASAGKVEKSSELKSFYSHALLLPRSRAHLLDILLRFFPLRVLFLQCKFMRKCS